MEVVKNKSSLFLDYEVYSFLQSKPQKKGKFKNDKYQQGLSTIEYEVNKYLSNMPCESQTPEQIDNVINALKPFALTMAEVFQLINLRPKELIDLTLIIEECESRFTEENLESLLQIIKENLPRDDDEDEEDGEGEEEEDDDDEENEEGEGEGEEDADVESKEEEENEEENSYIEEMDMLVDDSNYHKTAEDDIDGENDDDE